MAQEIGQLMHKVNGLNSKYMQPNFANLKPVGQPVTSSQPNFSSLQPSASVQSPQQNQSVADKIWGGLATAGNVVNSIFPGKQVGQAIGTLGALGIAKAKDVVTGSHTAENVDVSAPSPLQVGGDIAQGALTVAAPEIGNGATVAGRIGANTVLGAALGGTNAIAKGGNVGDVAKQSALGGAIGGAGSAVAEGVGALVNKLPSWFTQKALPKLDSANVDYALQNTDIGSISSNLEKSDQAVKSYGGQIQSILEHPQYANETGDGSASIQGVIEAFPNANLNPEKVAGIVGNVVPGSEKLVEKVANGDATLLEKNQLRQQLDLATKKVFTDSPTLTFNKQIAHSLANTLRNEVQSVAPETAPVFSEFSKEMNLNKALTVAQQKIQKGSAIGLYDILGAMGGSVGGLPGAAMGVAVEKAARSPAVQLGVAKGVQAIGKSAPVINAIGRGIKAPIINAISNSQ